MWVIRGVFPMDTETERGKGETDEKAEESDTPTRSESGESQGLNLPDLNRRGFLGTTGVGLTAALTGYTDVGEVTGTKRGAGQSSSVSLNFWDLANVQSQEARKRVGKIVSRFEKQNGASVKTNYSGYKQLQGAKWIKAFDRGNQPPVFDTEPTYMGRFYENDFILPYNQYKADLPSQINDELSWIFDTYSKAMQGWEQNAYDIPWGFLPRNGMQVRADHMREAGLNPDKEFPPKNLSELKNLAQTLQENGPGRWGFQMFGAIYDWMDTFQPMMASRNPTKAEFLNQDWSSTNFDTDTYKNTISEAMKMYRQMDIGSPATPTISDEKTTNLMLQGQVSMSSVEWLNIPTVLSRRPELYKSGDLRWAPFYGQGSGAGVMGYFSVGLSRKPENVDQQKWSRKRDASLDLMKIWLGDWNQKTALNTLGAFPANRSAWEETSLPGEKQHNTVKSAFAMAKNAEAVWETHPAIATIKDTMAGKAMQDIYKGADVNQRLDRLAKDAQSELDGANS